jgi:putative DNA primase/helicase
MAQYAAAVKSTNTKGMREAYSEAEVQATLRSAYTRPPREPWGSRNGHMAEPPSAGSTAEDQGQQARVEDDWPEPEPLGGSLPPVLPFDERYLPAALRPMAHDTAERLQVPIDLPAAALVVCLAGTVNRRAVVQPKDNDPGWTVVPNLWGAAVASSGFLKTPTLQAILHPLNAIQADWRRAHADAMKDYARAKEKFDLQLKVWKDGFAAATKKGHTTPPRPAGEPEQPKLRRLIVNDATFEALHQTMADNPAGILAVRDELTGWWAELDKPGREGERAFCLEAWNGDTGHTIDRIGRGTIHVPACCMSFIGGIQPARLRAYRADALKDGPANDGLIQRFQVAVWPDPERAWRRINRPANETAKRQAERIFRSLVELDAEHPARFFFDPDGQELFWEWLEELEAKVRGNELHPALISHLSKYRSLMPSLALLFCLADLADQAGEGEFRIGSNTGEDKLRIPLENVQQAAAMCEYLESHARRVYSSLLTPQMRAAHELAARIKRREIGAEGIFSSREVYRKGWAGLDSPELAERATEVLQDAGWIRPVATEPKPAGGRAATRFAVNPKVWRPV